MARASLEVRGHHQRNRAARLQLRDFFAVLIAVSDADKNPPERPFGKKGIDRLPAVVIGPQGWDQELCDLVFGTERCEGCLNPMLLRLTERLDHRWSFLLTFDGPGGEP